MTKDKISSLISLAVANHKEAERLAKDEREKMAAELHTTLSDKAKPYIDKLLAELEQGSVHGIVEYRVSFLPQDDFMSDHASCFPGNMPRIKHNTVTSKIVSILKEYNINGKPYYDNETKQYILSVNLDV